MEKQNLVKKIKKTDSGYEDRTDFSCTFYYDQKGLYLGQEQINCLDEDIDAPPTLFFKARENQAEEFKLTQEEINSAI